MWKLAAAQFPAEEYMYINGIFVQCKQLNEVDYEIELLTSPASAASPPSTVPPASPVTPSSAQAVAQCSAHRPAHQQSCPKPGT
jgi:hypothetical protein